MKILSLQCINSCSRRTKNDLAELPKCTSTKVQTDNSLSYRRDNLKDRKIHILDIYFNWIRIWLSKYTFACLSHRTINIKIDDFIQAVSFEEKNLYSILLPFQLINSYISIPFTLI